MVGTLFLPPETEAEEPRVPAPMIKVVETTEQYGKFMIEPLRRGYGITIGNPLRRMLLSSIPGTAITWVKIEGVLHEYSVIPNVKEEVMEFLLNVRGVRIRSVTGRPGKMRLEVAGEGRVAAGDIATTADFVIVNPELHLATLDSSDATLSVEFNVEQGQGYNPATQIDGLPVGVLPVDAVFSPVRKVNYVVELTRVRQVTDYERLVLEVWTDRTTTPIEAVKSAAEMLVNHFFLFSNLSRLAEGGVEAGPTKAIPPELYQMPIEQLELSPRTLNCLKRGHITKVGQVLETLDSELLKIRNFGEKSLQELHEKLKALGVLDEQEEPSVASTAEEPEEAQAVAEETEETRPLAEQVEEDQAVGEQQEEEMKE